MVEAEVRICGFSVQHVVAQSNYRLRSNVIYYPVYPKAFSHIDYDYGVGFLAWRLHGAAIGHLGV